MKSKFAIFTAVALLSLSAAASEPQTVVLDDGSTAVVLSQKGVNTTYVKEAKTDTDGKVKLVQDQVFDGERLVKKADGECLKIKLTLVSMKDFSSGGLKVQLPTVHTESHTVSCKS